MERIYCAQMEDASKEKEFFYVGIAHDPESGCRIIKFGTTNDLKRRKSEHRRKVYKNFPLHDFEYVHFIKLSHANTIRVENGVRDCLRQMIANDEMYVKNDRYVLRHNDTIVLRVKVIEKTYDFRIEGDV